MAKPKHPSGPPMTLGDVRQLGVQRLIASCLNDACRHTALIEVSSYTADTEVPSFRRRMPGGEMADNAEVFRKVVEQLSRMTGPLI